MAGFDAHARLTGDAEYTADLSAPDQLHMAVLRSPVAHGTILRLDVAEAASMPGVAVIVTAADLAKAGVKPLALRAPLTDTDGPFHEPRRPVLAEEKVAYAGQPVAAIVAETPEQAQDVHAFIREQLTKCHTSLADRVRILYGGSVKSTNAETLFGLPDVDGGLVGGASLTVDDFVAIGHAALA